MAMQSLTILFNTKFAKERKELESYAFATFAILV